MKLSARRRALLEPAIRESCGWALGEADVEEIDRLNIFAATMLAMSRAVEALCAAFSPSCEQYRPMRTAMSPTPRARRNAAA